MHHCGLPRSQIYKLNIIPLVFSDRLLVCVFSPNTFFGRLWAAFELSWEVYFVHNRRNFVFRQAPAATRNDQEGISYTIQPAVTRYLHFLVKENLWRKIFKRSLRFLINIFAKQGCGLYMFEYTWKLILIFLSKIATNELQTVRYEIVLSYGAPFVSKLFLSVVPFHCLFRYDFYLELLWYEHILYQLYASLYRLLLYGLQFVGYKPSFCRLYVFLCRCQL